MTMTLCPTCQRPIDSAALPFPLGVVQLALHGSPLDPPIVVGSVVTLVAGGPLSTVVERSGTEARIVWTDDLGKPHELTVDVRALRTVAAGRPADEPSSAPDGGMVQ